MSAPAISALGRSDTEPVETIVNVPGALVIKIPGDHGFDSEFIAVLRGENGVKTLFRRPSAREVLEAIEIECGLEEGDFDDFEEPADPVPVEAWSEQ